MQLSSVPSSAYNVPIIIHWSTINLEFYIPHSHAWVSNLKQIPHSKDEILL